MQLSSETLLHHGRTQQDIKTYLGFHAKLPKFPSIVAKLKFSPKILIQVPNIKFQDNHLAEDTLFHTDRWTVMTKPIIHFCNFANVPRHAYDIYSGSNLECRSPKATMLTAGSFLQIYYKASVHAHQALLALGLVYYLESHSKCIPSSSGQ